MLDGQMLQQQWHITCLALGGLVLAAVVSEAMCSSADCSWVDALKALITVCTAIQVSFESWPRCDVLGVNPCANLQPHSCRG